MQNKIKLIVNFMIKGIKWRSSTINSYKFRLYFFIYSLFKQGEDLINKGLALLDFRMLKVWIFNHITLIFFLFL